MANFGQFFIVEFTHKRNRFRKGCKVHFSLRSFIMSYFVLTGPDDISSVQRRARFVPISWYDIKNVVMGQGLG